MTDAPQVSSFGYLFKKYRLRSEIETLAEFGDLLADEGYIYETSLFTRWQKGERIPRDREVILSILKIFAQREGLLTIEEANEIIESTNQRKLSLEEAEELSNHLISGRMQTLPACPQLFIGKKELLKDATWYLMQKVSMVFSGLPGSGKTYVSLFLAHQLKDYFRDGIYWYRADVKNAISVVDSILSDRGYPLQGFASIDQKIKKLSDLLKGKKVLLILDNLNEDLDEHLEVICKLPVVFIATSVSSTKRQDIKEYTFGPFTPDEYHQVSIEILGKPFVELHEARFKRMGAALGMLPILIVLSLKQIYHSPKDFDEFLGQIDKVGFPHAEYDGKSLYGVLDMLIQKVPVKYQDILTICAVFEGGDFSAKLIAQIFKLSQKDIKKIFSSLMSYSLMEESVKDRYRLHPVIRDFIKRRLTSREYVLVSELMISTLSTFQIGDNKYLEHMKYEYTNLKKLLVRLYSNKEYYKVIQIWEKIGNYVFNCGDWAFVEGVHCDIEESYHFTRNDKGLVYFLIEDLARLYFFQNRDHEMRLTFIDISKLSEKLKDPVIDALIAQKQGIISLFQNNNNKAIELLQQSISVLKRVNHFNEPMIKSYSYLGQLYLREKNYLQSSRYMRLALDEAIKLNNISVLCFVYAYNGHLFLMKGDIERAKEYFIKALKLSEKSNMIVAKAMSYEGLGILYSQKKGNKQLSMINQKKSEEIYNQLGITYNRRIIH